MTSPEVHLTHRPKGIHSSKHSPLRESTTKASQAKTEDYLYADYTSNDNLPKSLHPTHFLIRPRISPSHPARLVPLIPIDLLPDYISIDGLDRHLSTAQVNGMKSIGTFDRPAGTYKLCFMPADMDHKSLPIAPADTPASSSGSAASGSTVSGPDLSQASSDTDTDRPRSQPAKAPKKSGSAPVDHILASASAAAAQHLPAHPGKKAKKPFPSSGGGGAPSAAPPGSPCRHYCHHGTCRFGAHCRYKHVVPLTPEGLRGVGLKELPAWLVQNMREAEALKRILASREEMVEDVATAGMGQARAEEEEKMERVRAARERRMAAAHEAAAAAALGEREMEDMLVDI